MAAVAILAIGIDRVVFQSLFCWIGNGGLFITRYAPADTMVSILVLLDWEWRLPDSAIIRLSSRGFNPCSVGLGMAASPERWPGVPGCQFQSLFCWIGNGGGPGHADRGQRLGCFNPCSVGLGMAAPPHEDHDMRPRRFQSLFCWIGNGGAADIRRCLERQGMFQSLFCWIGNGGIAAGIVQRAVAKGFQSLFCWIGNGGSAPSSSSTSRTRCFNPCSVGLGMAACRPGHCRPGH